MERVNSTSTAGEASLWHLDDLRERRNQRVRDEFLLRHLPLAYSLARLYAGEYGTEEELVRVASRGLVRAVQQFEPTGEAPFAEFAEPLIIAELEDFVQESAARREVRPATRGRGSAAADDAVAAAIGRQPHVRDLAGFLGCDVGALVGGLMLAVEREPHLIPSPAARAEPAPPTRRRITHG
jgi:RNA polymerase sigma-B factor